MSKLCLSTYLNVLTIYKCPQDSGQKKILNALIKCLCDNPEPINAQDVSHIKSGERNLPRIVRDKLQERNYQHPHYLENFKSNVEYLLDPNKTIEIYKALRFIALNDNDIGEDCVIDYISQSPKRDLNYTGNYLDFIAGVFLYVLRLKNDKTKEYAAEITENYCKKAVQEYDTLAKKVSLSTNNDTFEIIMDSDIPSQAKSFCRKHEDSIELLPLCQVANIVNPIHQHVNKMYSDYCDFSDELKKQIMQEIDCPMIYSDDKNMFYHLLGNLTDDVEALGLASKDKTYMLTQYVVKTLYYEKIELADPNPSIFPKAPSKLFPNIKTSTLSQFISDYLFFKDKNMGVTIPIPFNWMFTNLNFAYCPESELIPWLNLFIISSCYNIPKPISNVKNKKDNPILPTLYDIKTIEDLHFLALLMLYDTYLCE